jgi:DNA-binding MarR family transcriptional regulator
MTARPDDTQFAAELRLVLGRVNRKLRVRTASGLTPSQSSIIATLAAAGPLHLGELARREAVTAPTASRAVDRLVELELVERMTDPDDARRHTVALTPRGRAAASPQRDKTGEFPLLTCREGQGLRPRDRPGCARAPIEFVSGHLVIYDAPVSAESFSIAATAAGPALCSQ